MRRRTFLQISGAASAGMGIFSGKMLDVLFAEKPRWIELPDAKEHVRHGLLGKPQSFWHYGLPELKRFQRDVFFADGCAAGADDLQQLRLVWKKEATQFCFSPKALFLSDGVRHAELDIAKGFDQHVRMPNGLHLALTASPKERQLTLRSEQRVMIAALSGHFNHDGRTGDYSNALVLPARQSVEVCLNAGSLVAMFSSAAIDRPQ